MSDYGDVSSLMEINNKLAETDRTVDALRVHNPAQEVRNALSEFATTRLRRVEEDAAFNDVVKTALRQRIPEATFKELMDLLKITSETNNQMAESLIQMFSPANSDKTIIDRVNDNGAENTATQLYNSTDDKKVIQAFTYLNAILSKAVAEDDRKTIDVEVKDVEESE
jgi:hypothetical protein